MANDLSASIKEQWSMDYQDVAEKINVFSSIANFRYESTLKVGDVVHRPYVSDVTVNTLGSEGSYTRQDISTTDETLTVDQEKEASFYIKDIDEFQSHYPTREKMARQCAVKLSNQIDGDVLGEVVNADNYIDDGDLGGTAGNPITLTTSNIGKIFSAVGRKLESEDNEPGERRFAAISPYFKQILLDKLEGRDTALGDKTAMNGHVGSYFDFELFNSNATYWEGVLGMATNPTANDTVVINGVTFTFVASPSAAGDVDLGADVDTSRANLEAAINAGSGAGTAYIEVSTADRKLLKNIVASNNDTTDKLTVTSEGHGHVAVSETLTATADGWDSEIQHLLFGQGRPVDTVVQRSPKMIVKDRDGYIGKDIVNYIVYGLKTFRDGKRRMVDVRIDTSSL